MNLIRVVISGTIEGEYDFPNEMFSGFCYEGWGNCWAMIEGIEARYIPAQELISHPKRFKDVDILMAELGQRELLDIAHDRDVFVIATQSGAGFDIDREASIEAKLDFIRQLDRCDIILSTTFAGKEYLEMFTVTPVLDIPLPMDTNRFAPRPVEKFDEFTVCLGEIIESCYDDRPLQLEAAAIAQSLGMRVVSSIAPHSRDFGEDELRTLGFDIELYPHQGLYEMSCDYLARSHVSMMLGQRPTFGRFVYVSWAIGVPCIASRYQCQERICPELTVGCEQIGRIKDLLVRLNADAEFYRECREKGLENLRSIMSQDVIALRLVDEILPIYFKGRARG